jgi:hypothetical protein
VLPWRKISSPIGVPETVSIEKLLVGILTPDMFVPGKIPAGFDNEKERVFPAKAGFRMVYVDPFKENVIPS